VNVQTTVQKSISKTRDPPATLQISRWIPLPHKCIDGPGKVMGNKARSHYVESGECILVKASVKIYLQLTSRRPRKFGQCGGGRRAEGDEGAGLPTIRTVVEGGGQRIEDLL